MSVGDRTTTIQDTSCALMGTRFPVEGDAMRLFLHWGKGLHAQPLDMDLSARIVLSNNKVLECAYYSLTCVGATHSGDIRHIPEMVGTAEYIELSLPTLEKAKAKYVMFTCNAYSTGALSPNLMVGWMDSAYPMKVSDKRGVAYDPSCVQHMVRVSEGNLSKGLVFGVLDVAKREIIWLEMPFTSQTLRGASGEVVEAAEPGAEFGVYSDAAMTNKLTTLVTDEGGFTDEWTYPTKILPTQTVEFWIKEEVPSPGHDINELFNQGKNDNGEDVGANHIVLSGGETGELTVTEPITRDPISLEKSEEGNTDNKIPGAVYRLTWIDDGGYYTGKENTELKEDCEFGSYIQGNNDNEDIEPFETRTWYYVTDSNGYWINNDEQYLANSEDYIQDELFGSSDHDHNLPLGAYTIQEVEAPDGYYLDNTVMTGRITDTTHTYHHFHTDKKVRYLSVTGTKHWDDGNNADGIRPDKIYVQLYQDGYKYGDTQVVNVNADGTKTRFEFSNLPEGVTLKNDIKDDNGNIIEHAGDIHYYEYKVVELNGSETDAGEGPPAGYTVEYQNYSARVKVGGNWVYNQNLGQYPFLSSTGTYNETTGEVEWSEPVRINDTRGTVHLTNHHTPEVMDLTIKKDWKDFDDAMDKRPNKIYVLLYWDAENYNAPNGQTIELNATNNWTYKLEGIDKNFDGKPRRYHISEVSVDGYTCDVPTVLTDLGDNKYSITITNTLASHPASIRKTDGSGRPLQNVSFELYCDEESGNAANKKAYLTYDSSTGKYVFDGFTSKSGNSSVMKTSTLGFINVESIPYGKWHFKEIDTAAGKMIYDGDIDFEVTSEGKSFIADGNGGTAEGSDIEVRNNNVIMPQTGGAGTTMFAALSLLCIAMAAVFVLALMKRRGYINR